MPLTIEKLGGDERQLLILARGFLSEIFLSLKLEIILTMVEFPSSLVEGGFEML